MTKKSNVHPDHYKTAGREPVGQGSVQEIEKQIFSKGRPDKTLRSKRRTKRKAISTKGPTT